MKLLPIIEHLRNEMPVWFSRVDAVATYEIALDRSRIELDGTAETLPAFYLMLGGDNVTQIITQPNVEVNFDESLSVIAVLKNIKETGKYAQDQVHDVRKVLMACLLNYSIVEDPKLRESSTLVYAGGRMLAIDDARYVHEFQFKQLSRFDVSDGWDQTRDLEPFDALFVDWNMTHAPEATYPNAQDQIKNIYPLNP